MSELEPTITELEPTATERLRALLDERVVEYELTAWSCGAAVWWRDSSGTMWRAHDNEDDELLSFYAYNSVTPEQAVEATLGSCNCSNSERTETCRDTSKWTNVFKCSMCGFEYDFITDPYQGPHFCPSCGRKVVDE